MDFSKIFEVENKQRLNLSDHAKAVLLNDIAAFEDEGALKLSSAFINRVFNCYRDEASSTLTASLRRKQQELEMVFSKLDEEQRSIAIKLMLREYKKQIEESINKRVAEKGESVTIRVNDESIYFLGSEEGQEEGKYHKDKVGNYMKAVLEEYCEHSYAERELIYFKDDLKTIRHAIANQKLLKLTLRSKNRFSGHNNIHYIKPLCIRQDKERLYNYIVGLQCSTQNGPWEMGAVRLTSILKCKDLAESGFISKPEKQRILETIREKGVQYISDSHELIKVVVEFTPYGENMYRKMLHLRPLYTRKTGLEYEFECTKYQAETYFFKFGSRVRILEPRSMAEDFKNWYLSAAKKYE